MTKRIDAAHTHAVQSAGNFIGIAIELTAACRVVITTWAAGLSRRRYPCVDGMHGVIDDGDRVIDVNGDVDLVGKTGKSLVDRVITTSYTR